MLILFFARHSKQVAWFLACTMYAQMLFSMQSGAYVAPPRVYHTSSTPWNDDLPLPGHVAPPAAPAPLANRKEEPESNFGTGPTQPEMQSFQSVNVNNMVDLFSGDFSYNIPLMDVGGYPVNLHYQSGITMDQEASWVGLGWNINPGSITRNMRGLPDDFSGEEQVTKTVSMKENKTLGLTIGGSIELFGFFSIGPSAGVFHNNYKGWGTEVGLNANINAGIGSKGSLTAGLSIANNSQNGLDVSPSMGFTLSKNEGKTIGNITIGTNYNSRMGIQALQLTGQVKQHWNDEKKQRYGIGTSGTASISFAQPSFTPKVTVPFSSSQFTFSAKVGGELWGLHPSGYVRGYASRQSIANDQKMMKIPAYGYLYYQQAKGSPDVLLDFNREKEVSYRNGTPHIALPIYTYDTYSISGEGTGGMFRPYRNDIGYVYDHAVSTKSESGQLALDLGFGTIFHGGVDVNVSNTNTRNYPWLSENAVKDVIGFKERDSLFEEVYFKNPGEKTSIDREYYKAIGGDSLIRVNLSPLNGDNISNVSASRNISIYNRGRVAATRALDANATRMKRAKRTQVISYLTAREAELAGLDKRIRAYGINNFPSTSCKDNFTELPRITDNKRPHHISELTVLNGDGKRYIYGLPVYNVEQRDISFATNTGDTTTGLVTYTPGTENDPSKNDKGKDHYYNSEDMPAYAHSFLLSGILSPDYVDVTGDGITEDDNGDAIRFNYTQVYSEVSPYTWRFPIDQNKASYNEGLKTDNRDERGSISTGSREVWYLNSVESKSMIATFKLDTEVRKDSYGVNGDNGGLNTSKKLYRLKEINLYTKADFLKYGASAKPIKTVHFEYDYSLCPQNASSIESQGKLTLKKVWFTYSKNEKGKKNPYVFTYNQNKTYNNRHTDRWGNYKATADNPGSSGKELSNADYPYTLQDGVKTWDSTKAGQSVAAWTLSQIKLPSGGRISVTYESDDYAYVQNRRAMQFFQVAGFGPSATGPITASLYERVKPHSDYFYAFVNVTEAVSGANTDAIKADIRAKYLEGVNKLYFRLYVRMPDDRWGKGYEYIPCYADIEDYGMYGSSGDKKIWVRLGAVKGESPTAMAAIQFLRLNLPSKAYPYSEPGDNVSIKDVVGMFASIGGNIKDAVDGFGGHARKDNRCNQVWLERSFARLNNPKLKKYGGGLRVKKVEIADNWNNMTQMQESTYGMEYTYTTVREINGVPKIISSGVASYEPAMGNDENPFHLPIDYVDKVGALAPSDYLYSEEPFGETFFPSPSVGYSKVRVQTIHKTKQSATGIDETEFYTAYDFPVITEFTPLDKESKKTFNPKLKNILKFDAKHYVTLSQGFKVELNDMHGKTKSQASYAQNDLQTPISYTFNYYRLQQDNSLQKKLHNTVSLIDSTNGVVNQNGLIGKDIEIMVDVREQKSSTFATSVEANADFIHPFPPITIFTAIPLPSSEVNRFRSIAVMKVVNTYGILDSVIHIEKGSKVSTRNMVYDGETGDVLLSQTNNEFDDPVYNFSYPAHWAYSGMSGAYKNIAGRFSKLAVRHGTIYYSAELTAFPAERYLESGDEILADARTVRLQFTQDVCNPLYYSFSPGTTPIILWAIDATKGKEGHRGIYLIDKNGLPFSGIIESCKIIRSGKRNLSSTPVGNITSLKSPLKVVDGRTRIVFDSTTSVIATAASKFKDFWKVDSTAYGKDTTYIGTAMADTVVTSLPMSDMYTMYQYRKKGKTSYHTEPYHDGFEASSFDKGNNKEDVQYKSWMLFRGIDGIPQGAVIKSASLYLYHHATLTHENRRTSNASHIKRVTGPWIGDQLRMLDNEKTRSNYFNEIGLGAVQEFNKASISATPTNSSVKRNDVVNVTSIVQWMLYDYYGTNRFKQASIMIRLQDPSGVANGNLSRLIYSRKLHTGDGCVKGCQPRIMVTYYRPCSDNSAPLQNGNNYYCYSVPKDTFICKPNIDTAVNPYRWGILGNWRMERAYTYYDRRAESDPLQPTNIRKDGEIKSFVPYWAFSNTSLQPSTDTFRWVWNSEVTTFNRKGFEIENHDPLNRYNSGQYGYNQTLPIAVAQNAKYREMMFEGFEDYDYKTDSCKRCQNIRFTDLAGTGTRVDTVSHTGLYSLRVPGNQTITTNVPITSYAADTVTAKLSIKLDSTAIVRTTVSGSGTGLFTQYMHDPSKRSCNNWVWSTLANSNIGTDWGEGGPSCGHDWFHMRWNGKIQPRYTGVYTFYVRYDDDFVLTVNGQKLFEKYGNSNFNAIWKTATISLQAGTLYNISVYHSENKGSAAALLYWESDLQPREIVPLSQLYPPATQQTDVTTTITTDTTWCVRLANVKGTRLTLDRFSPFQGKKIVVSAWVRQQTLCVNGNYEQVRMDLDFNSGSPSSFILKPKGNIIEGWQRIEDTLTIPASATSVSVKLKSTSSDAVYFDDIRIHPFNSNMKSFVYNPVNIRLMAELDENNYATFFEYDEEGTLIRVKKETERGIKTIRETRSALIKEQ